MSDEDEWGSWVDHDGSPSAPGVEMGAYWQTIWECQPLTTHENEGVIDEESLMSLDWRNWCQPVQGEPGLFWGRTLRYRIRKPRGMKVLEDLVENLPEPTPERVGEARKTTWVVHEA